MVELGMISEATAVALAGVSARTLSRFSEAGYLSIQTRGDGERFYSGAQIKEIFGSHQCDVEAPQTSAAEACTPNEPDTTTYYSPASPTPMVERATVPREASTETAKDEGELARLKNLVALQEKILDMKDTEITDLRSQRDWLRTRVEKLEEKGDRDQVLLLNETQALRQLIGLHHQQRRSSVRNILEWFGLASANDVRALPMNDDTARTATPSSGTIVVGKAANA